MDSRSKYSSKPIHHLSSVVTTRILPAALRETSYVEFSNLDLLLVPHHISVYLPVLLFYTAEECGGPSFSHILHTLKRSLSKVLITFYPMAGQVENTGTYGYPRLLCDGSGAVFTEACSSLELDDVIHDNFEPSAVLSGMDAAHVDPGPTCYQSFRVPVLIIQVTCFRCGGVAVGINMHHCVADGNSCTHFMKSWAEVARGDSISLLPCHNRALVKARVPTPYPVTGVDNVIRFERSTTSQQGMELQGKANSVQCFRLSGNKLDQLRKEAAVSTESSKFHFTSLHCVSAHLWRCFTKARGLSGEDVTAFMMFIDVRRKMDPPLPQGYFGNAAVSVGARTTAAELLNGPLSVGAGLIRDAISGVTGESLQALIDWKERYKQPTTAVWFPSVEDGHKFGDHMTSIEDGHKFGMSSWKHFGLYDLDFSFGRPVFGVHNGLTSVTPEGNSVWLPSGDDGGSGSFATFQVYLHPHAMANLRSHPSVPSKM